MLPQTVDEIVPSVVGAWNARDAARFAALFAENADFVNVVGLWWRNRDDIEKAHAYGFERIFPKAEMSVIRSAERVIGGTAILHIKWRLTGQVTPQGAEAGMRTGVFVLVAHHIADGWQLVAAQNTNIVPGAETHLVEGTNSSTASYR